MQFVPSQDSEKLFTQTLKSFLKSEQIVSTTEYWDVVEDHLQLLRNLPFTAEVAICNNLAFGLVTKKSDIDLFIVLKSDRFFIGRFLITLILHFKSLRRYGPKIHKRFCLSFFVADNDSNLNFKDLLIDEDVYFYNWFKNLVFLKNNFSLQKVIIDLNRDNFVLSQDFRFRNYKSPTNSKVILSVNFIERFFDNKFFNWLEKIMGFVQLKKATCSYKKNKCPYGIVIKNGTLKFHLSDIRIDFRAAYFSLFK